MSYVTMVCAASFLVDTDNKMFEYIIYIASAKTVSQILKIAHHQ